MAPTACTSIKPLSELEYFLQQTQEQGKLSRNGNLANPIHPLFASSNFPQATQAAEIEVDYDVFNPSLRLPSKILQTPQVRHFFFTLFFGRNERVGVKDCHGRELEAYHSDRTPATLSLADIAAVEQKLLELAKMVKFKVADLSREGKNWNGICVPDVPPAVPGMSVPGRRFRPGNGSERLPGVSSMISIAQHWYDAIKTHPGANRSAQSYLHDCFSVTMILLHELAHAAHYATVGVRQEDFFEDSLIAEGGCEIQARFLGATYYGKLGERAHLVEWPNHRVLFSYGDRIGCRNVEGVPKPAVGWTMPDAFVFAMFQECFWEWALLKGSVSFVPVAGYVRQAMEMRMRVPVPKTIADLFRPRHAFLGVPGQLEEQLTVRQTASVRERTKKVEDWVATVEKQPSKSTRSVSGGVRLPAGHAVNAATAERILDGEVDDEDGGVVL